MHPTYRISIAGLKRFKAAIKDGDLTSYLHTIKFNKRIIAVSDEEFKMLGREEVDAFMYNGWRSLGSLINLPEKAIRAMQEQWQIAQLNEKWFAPVKNFEEARCFVGAYESLEN